MTSDRQRAIIRQLRQMDVNLDKLAVELSADADVPPIMARAFIQSTVSLSVTATMFNSIAFPTEQERCQVTA